MRSTATARYAMLLSITLAATATAGCELAVHSWKAEQRETWTKDYAVAANGRFELRNTNGKIDVSPSADGRVHVNAVKIAKGASDEAARDVLKQVEIVEQVDQTVVHLEARFRKQGMFGQSANVEFTVQVPPTLTIDIDNTNGRISVEGLAGAVDMETTNGGIRGHGLRGTVKAGTTNGGVELDMAALADGGVDVSTTNGGVKLALPADAKADVSASCTNGGIDVSDLPLQKSESSRRKVEGQMNGGGPRVRAETTNGGITFSRTAAR